eukprot:3321662-Rhodomonas_salina.1
MCSFCSALLCSDALMRSFCSDVLALGAGVPAAQGQVLRARGVSDPGQGAHSDVMCSLCSDVVKVVSEPLFNVIDKHGTVTR